MKPTEYTRAVDLPPNDAFPGGLRLRVGTAGNGHRWPEVSQAGRPFVPVFDGCQAKLLLYDFERLTRCDHIRHQWRGVDLPCATPGCVEGHDRRTLAVTYKCCATSVSTDWLKRDNWDGGWSWRLA